MPMVIPSLDNLVAKVSTPRIVSDNRLVFAQVRSSSRKSGSVLWRVLVQFGACLPNLTGILFLSILSLPLTLLYPLPLKIAVDGVLGHQSLPPMLSAFDGRLGLLGLALTLMVGLAVLVNLQALASWWLQTYAGEKLA